MDCELLAPAGNFDTALAAFEAGADAVYCGLTEFSARAFADNFTLEDLKNQLSKDLNKVREEMMKLCVSLNSLKTVSPEK